MNHPHPSQFILSLLGMAALSLAASIPVRADNAAAKSEASKALRTATQIECITPDGRVSPVSESGVSQRNAPATIKDDETLSCSLKEGKTVFIITFSKVAMLDRFTFVNENAAAQGQLEIAVSNSRLPAESPAWTAVDGAIPFARKRLFNLSMIGVEARCVKLSFKVGTATAGIDQENIARYLSPSKNFIFGFSNVQARSEAGAFGN